MTKRKAVIFDMDGVLVQQGSSWKMVHEFFGGIDNVKDLKKHIKGEIDDKEFMRRTIAKWPPPLHISKIKEALSGFEIMPGAKETIRELKKKGFIIGIVSCGLDVLAEQVAKELGINLNYILAEGLEIDKQGYLTGEGVSRVELLKKDEALIRLTKKMKVSLKRTFAVGNSKYDIPMLLAANMGIAFNPEDEEITQIADAVARDKNLCGILKYIL